MTNATGNGTSTWQTLNVPGTPPTQRAQAAGVYDAANNRFVIFAGQELSQNVNFNDTWVLTNANGLSEATPPTAVAGANQTINAAQTVYLNGSGSFAPNTPSTSLGYAWSFVSKPSNSSTTLSGANAETPSVFADVPGTYIVQLVVTDPSTGLSSSPSQVTVSSVWTPPTANAGPGQSVVVGTTVTLSGSGADPNGLTLSYTWSFVSKPSDSVAALSAANTPNASFTPDVAGTDGFPSRGALDGPGPSMDWVVEATAQGVLYQDLTTALRVLPR